jgi:uncharacterized protein (DUF2236 family)
VHNALTDSFLQAYLSFGPETLSEPEQDRFVVEQAGIGRLLGAEPIPTTANSLRHWISEHPALADSPGMHEAIDFLRSPPLPSIVLPAYQTMVRAAAATIPPDMNRLLGLHSPPGSIAAGRAVTGFLRWSLGSSPTWNLALIRCGAPIPEGRFHQPLPVPVTQSSEPAE